MEWTTGRIILLIICATVLLTVGALCGFLWRRDNERETLVETFDKTEIDALGDVSREEFYTVAPGTPVYGPQLPEHNHLAGAANPYGIHGCAGCAADAIRQTGPRTWDTGEAEQLAHTVDKLLSTRDLSNLAVQVRIMDAYAWLAGLETPAEVVARITPAAGMLAHDEGTSYCTRQPEHDHQAAAPGLSPPAAALVDGIMDGE